MEEDTDLALLPLRISKAPQHNQTLSKSPLRHGPPYAIPRRSSSFAIRARDSPQFEDVNAQKARRDEKLSSKPLFLSGKRETRTDSTFRNHKKTSQELIKFDTHNTPEQNISNSGIFSRLLHSLDPRSRDQNEVDNGNHNASLVDQLSTSLIPQFSRDTSNYRTSSTSTSIDNGNIIPFTTEKTWRGPSRLRTPPLVRPTLQIPRNRRKTGARFIQSIPITTANLELLADIQEIDDESDVPLWLTVEVTAAVGIDRALGDDFLLPLDVMIVVDNLITTSAASLKDVYDNALLVAAETTNKNDCVAICAIYDHHEAGLIPFLPLAMYDIDTIKRAFDYIPHLGPQVDRTRRSDVRRALREASNMLIQLSNRGALCHVFLITADSTLHLPGYLPQDRVQLHTVSPDPIFGSGPWSKLSGFHLAYGIYFGDSPIAKQAQIHKIELLFKQLRMGYYPGALSELGLNLISGDGYAIESVLGDTTCKELRPGEKWSVVVKIRDHHRAAARNIGYNSDRTDALMNELFEMLEVTPACYRTILSACLEYRHSCLPNAAVVKIERNWEEPQSTQSDVGHFGSWSKDSCGSAIPVDSGGHCEISRENGGGDPKGYQEFPDEELDNRTLERGGPSRISGHESSLGTDSSKSSLHSIPCSTGLGSIPRSSPCEILGNATNKGRTNGRQQNHQATKPSSEIVDSNMSTSENRKPRKKTGKKFTTERLAMETEDMPDMAQHEWHDIGWC